MNDLTIFSQKVLRKLYKQYLSDIESGIDKNNAISFNDSQYIHEHFFPDSPEEKVEQACRELSRANYIHCSWYENRACIITLTEKAIFVLEYL